MMTRAACAKMRRPHRGFKPFLYYVEKTSEINDVETSSKKQSLQPRIRTAPRDLCPEELQGGACFCFLASLSAAASRSAQHPVHSFAVQFHSKQETMKTTSALLLACAGSAAAFAPQASNKVRQTKQLAQKRRAGMQIGNFRFGVDRREWPSYFAVLVAK